MQVTKPESGGFTVALKPGTDITLSPKQEVSVDPQKELMSSKKFKTWRTVGLQIPKLSEL